MTFGPHNLKWNSPIYSQVIVKHKNHRDSHKKEMLISTKQFSVINTCFINLILLNDHFFFLSTFLSCRRHILHRNLTPTKVTAHQRLSIPPQPHSAEKNRSYIELQKIGPPTSTMICCDPLTTPTMISIDNFYKSASTPSTTQL